MGDFNSVLFGSERSSGEVGSTDFLDMVHQLGLIDLSFTGS